MTTSVHILAVGARTPVGLNVESTAAAVRAGISRVRYHPTIVDKYGSNIRGALDARIEPRDLGWRRLVVLARSALVEVINKLDPLPVTQSRLPVLLSSPEDRPGFDANHRRKMLSQLGSDMRSHTKAIELECVETGHAGGLAAMNHAVRRIVDGTLQLCIVGWGRELF